MRQRIRSNPSFGDRIPRRRRSSSAARSVVRRACSIVVLSGVVGAISACEVGPQSGLGLRLPPGDAVRGEQAFSDLGCVQCHVVSGDVERVRGEGEGIVVALGGKVDHITTHGELVTAIVNPSHGFPRRYAQAEVFDGDRSKMPGFNDRMTVEQLIDLTEFLQSKYELDPHLLYGP